MVRLYKWMFSPKFAITTLCVAIASISVSYADGFYTIIGPDGRPMIVPSKRIDQKKQPIPKIEERKPQTQQNQPIVDAVQKTSTEKNKIIESGNAPSVSNNEWQKKLVLVPPPIKSTSQAAPSSDSSLDKSKFTIIDGVEYVNNEYLEDQEFNIEGKKRFYLMPDGLGRTESVERKKGVSRSTLDQLFNRQTQDQDSTVVLAPTYMRLSSQELEAAFEQDKCFIK
ncbi:putative pilus assembly protein FilE, partial [Acinetobacter baumannii]|nr:putative pilus assembly protein FilE [Acinetobacter baumannii]EKV8308412.1 putative pilus assembly protein FilE [Acinetobacter baumannii]EKV9511280.1 putative pilus assembly protein FilE [Acinetobacter baumannii]EKW4603570.1 putative pilus assembly protein FilE [Acinetobacter baumannii]EKW4639833.1 putative pilus assembly protein FilE [Acinetobacter baumannii]